MNIPLGVAAKVNPCASYRYT